MALRDILNRFRKRGEKFKEIKEDDRLQTMLEQRKKNSNERELEGRVEEIRQNHIKQQLDALRKKDMVQNREVSVLKGKNIFLGHKSILTNNKKLFKMKPTIKTKSTFFHGGLQ